MLKIEAVKQTFSKGSANEKKALLGIDLELDSGDFLTVIGGNGAGKSTLLNCIAGINMIDEGKIILNQKDITFMTEHKRSRMIGHVFQDPLKGTAHDMSIAENMAIAFAKGQRRTLKPGLRKKDIIFFQKQLAFLELGLEERMKEKVGFLSGGQRQALTLLMATLTKPQLLLLDEHTAALDPNIARKVLYFTREIVAENKLTTIMVTHNMKDALAYGNRTIMMDEGKIILDISGDERSSMTVDDLVEKFEQKSGRQLDNDRMLLENQ